MHAFVTVGSTHFHSFIATIFTEKVLSVLRQKGYTDLVVQCGNSAFDLADSIKNGETQALRRSGVDIQFWKFKPDLEEDIKRADLVIAHAGTYAVLVPEL
jgi:beta-1,4-N-acetylglucosaminyltransferase